MEYKVSTWAARLKKLRIQQGVFCKQVPISQSYFSEVCSGKAENLTMQKYIRIESLIAAMERRDEQKAARAAAKLAKPEKTPKKDRAPKPKKV